MFEKIVVVDSTGLNTWGVERLKELGKEVVFYTGIPETDEEIVNRIGDADCVLVSYNTQIRRNVIEACPNIKYAFQYPEGRARGTLRRLAFGRRHFVWLPLGAFPALGCGSIAACTSSLKLLQASSFSTKYFGQIFPVTS